MTVFLILFLKLMMTFYCLSLFEFIGKVDFWEMGRSDKVWQTRSRSVVIKKRSHWDGGSNRNKKIMENIFSSRIGKHYKSNQQRNSEPAANIFLIVLILLRVTLYPLNAKVYFLSNEAMGDLKSLSQTWISATSVCYYQRKKYNPQVSIIIMTTEKSLELGLENLGLSSSFVS